MDGPRLEAGVPMTRTLRPGSAIAAAPAPTQPFGKLAPGSLTYVGAGAGVVVVAPVVVAPVVVVPVVVVLVVVVVDVVVAPSAYADAAPSAARRRPRTRRQTPRGITPVCRSPGRLVETDGKCALAPAPSLARTADRHTIGGVEKEVRGEGSDEPTAEAPASARYGQVLQGVSAIIAPATLLTGIAFYFGWARVEAFDEYFGLDPSAVGYSTRDYVLNSLNALFLPVVVVLVVLLAVFLGHAFVTDAHRTGRTSPATLRRLSEVGLIVGALLLLVGALGVFGDFPFRTPYLVSTLFPAAGVLLIALAVDLRERLRGDPPLSTVGRVLVALFVAVCLFWATGLYARTVGRDEAARVASHLDELPGVALLSASDLALPSRGRQAVSVTGGTKSYAYGGLRLLARARDGTLFVLPHNWTPLHGALFAVPQGDATGLAFTAGKAPPASSLLTSGFTGNDVPSTGVEGSAPAPPQRRRLGPLVVQVEQGIASARVRLVNGTHRAISGVGVAVKLAKHAQPLVVGTAASCRVSGSTSGCKVDVIPPHHSTPLLVTYRGPRSTHGRLTVRLGGVSQTLQLQLSR